MKKKIRYILSNIEKKIKGVEFSSFPVLIAMDFRYDSVANWPSRGGYVGIALPTFLRSRGNRV